MKNHEMRKYSIIQQDPTLRTNLMSFGFECGMGWFPLIYELLDKLQAIEDRDKRGLFLTQVKEKFGELRVYTSYDTDEIFDLIQEYCEKSRSVCEICGAPASLKMTAFRWYRTLCDKHGKEMGYVDIEE